MINSLELKNLTVFKDATFEFGQNLNVFVGENGTGKSHLFKILYATCRTLANSKFSLDCKINKFDLAERLEANLLGTFAIDSLEKLISIDAAQDASVSISDFSCKTFSYLMPNFAKDADHLVQIEIKEDALKTSSQALFIQQDEILSHYDNFRSTLQKRALDFDLTYRDLADALNREPYTEEELKKVEKYYAPLEKLIEPYVVKYEDSKFYFEATSKDAAKNKITQDAAMVAEGHRKIGMLAYLIKNGSLGNNTIFFWDEPETSLNPKLLRYLLSALVTLSEHMQIFIATHSLFLLREFEILTEQKVLKDSRFFGLELSKDGLIVNQGNTASEIGSVAALDASLNQADRYLEVTED